MSPDPRLARLAKLLQTPGLPTQAALARGAEVDQPLVSRAMNGELKRYTPRVKELEKYVRTRISALAKIARVPTRATAQPRTGGVRPEVADKVVRSCRDYLRDGNDPVALLDQIAILRRVQRTRAGRPRKPAPP